MTAYFSHSIKKSIIKYLNIRTYYIEFTGIIDPFQLNRISDISLAIYDYEKTLYYFFAILSFVAVLNLMISVWQLINKGRKDTKRSIMTLITVLVLGILSGFTTYLPLFL